MRKHICVKCVVILMAVLMISVATTGCKRPAASPGGTASGSGATLATVSTDAVKSPDVTQPAISDSPLITYIAAEPTPSPVVQTQAPEATVQQTQAPTVKPSVRKTPYPKPTPNELGFTLYFADQFDSLGYPLGINDSFKAGEVMIFLAPTHIHSNITPFCSFIK